MTDKLSVFIFLALVAALALYFGFEIAADLIDTANSLRLPVPPER